jgi:hypothetical protein
MRRNIPFVLVGILVVLAGVFTVLSYRQSTASESSVKLLVPCKAFDLAVKPSTYVVSCADANSEFTDLHWTDWGSETAYATGVAKWNDCTPTCVNGHWRSEPATLWAWNPRPDLPHLSKFDGLTIYTEVTSSDPPILGRETIGVGGGGKLK